MHEILRNLYLGGVGDASSLERLTKLGIRAIVTCCTPFELPSHYRHEGVEYFEVYVEDMGTETIGGYFSESAAFIDSHIAQRQGVLVHCRSGVSRSATIVIAYLLLKKKFLLHDAFFHVRSKRDVVCPNIGFMSQLCELEKSLVPALLSPAGVIIGAYTSTSRLASAVTQSTVPAPVPSVASYDVSSSSRSEATTRSTADEAQQLAHDGSAGTASLSVEGRNTRLSAWRGSSNWSSAIAVAGMRFIHGPQGCLATRRDGATTAGRHANKRRDFVAPRRISVQKLISNSRPGPMPRGLQLHFRASVGTTSSNGTSRQFWRLGPVRRYFSEAVWIKRSFRCGAAGLSRVRCYRRLGPSTNELRPAGCLPLLSAATRQGPGDRVTSSEITRSRSGSSSCYSSSNNSSYLQVSSDDAAPVVQQLRKSGNRWQSRAATGAPPLSASPLRSRVRAGCGMCRPQQHKCGRRLIRRRPKRRDATGSETAASSCPLAAAGVAAPHSFPRANRTSAKLTSAHLACATIDLAQAPLDSRGASSKSTSPIGLSGSMLGSAGATEAAGACWGAAGPPTTAWQTMADRRRSMVTLVVNSSESPVEISLPQTAVATQTFRLSPHRDSLQSQSHQGHSSDTTESLDWCANDPLSRQDSRVQNSPPATSQSLLCCASQNSFAIAPIHSLTSNLGMPSRGAQQSIPSICITKYIDWYVSDLSGRAAVPDLDP